LNIQFKVGCTNRSVFECAECCGARHVVLDQHRFLPMYCDLPSAACGYVYMLVSLSCAGHYYVGETMNLKCCLRQHNAGYGVDETRGDSVSSACRDNVPR